MTLPHIPLLLAESMPTSHQREVISPYNRKPIATIAQGDKEHVESALKVAYQTFKNKKAWLPMPKRIEILTKVIELMKAQQEYLAVEAAREGGKPLIDSRVEVARAIDGVTICIETLRTDAGNVIPMNFNSGSADRIAFTQKEPIGVVVALSAFNHPVNLIIHQVASAVAAGCPVIVKPASDTPLSCMRIVEIFREAGLPKEWCQALLVVNNNLATDLACDPRVAFLTFIGSAKVGWTLRSKLAPGTRCSLEHGGVAPVIITENADLKKAIPLITKGGFYHAGQVCVSVQRVYVHEKIAKTFAYELAEAAKRLVVGDPTKPETEVGPLIRPEELKRIDEWVKEAVDNGASLLCGGKAISETCYECTVLYNVPDNVKISTMEVFGPVVCLYIYTDLDEALEKANSLNYAFQAAVFTQDLNTMLYVYKNIDASAVMVNDHTAFRVDSMPFAGLRQSGLGVGGIPYSIHDMQIEKMIVIKQ